MRCAASTFRTALALHLLGVTASLGVELPERQRPQEPWLSFRDESSVAWVLVPVTVRGSSGHVKDLRLEDFRLRVDGHPVSIESFESGPDAPIRLFYLQDLSGSMANAGKLEASRAALSCFLAGTRPGDELALASFASGKTRLDVAFTTEKARLEDALATWQGYGTTALHDAVARLPEMRTGEESLGLRQAAVLVTDGGDNASTIPPQRAREILRAAELPVYVLDLTTHRDGRDEPDSYAHLLRLLAIATGGRYYSVPVTDTAPVCAAVSAELRYQYVLGFRTRESGKTAPRDIHVEVGAKGSVELAHRRGYVGRPPFDPANPKP